MQFEFSPLYPIPIHALYIEVSPSQLLQTPQDSWDHISLPFLLLIWKRREIDREGDRRKELSTYLPYQNLCVEGNETLLVNRREWNTPHLDLGKVMTSDEAALWNLRELFYSQQSSLFTIKLFSHNKASRKTKFSLLVSTPVVTADGTVALQKTRCWTIQTKWKRCHV